MQRQWRARGEAIRKARITRWRTTRAFAAATGLSESLLDDIENGRRGNFSPATVDAIETTLGWAPGSFARVGAGGRPHFVRDPELKRLMSAWPELSRDARRILASLAEHGVSGQ